MESKLQFSLAAQLLALAHQFNQFAGRFQDHFLSTIPAPAVLQNRPWISTDALPKIAPYP